MSFAAEVDRGLAEGRGLAEARMRDTCIVERKTGRTTQSEDNGRELPIYQTVLVSKCRIQRGDAFGDEVDAGGRREVITATTVHLPWDVDPMQTDDRITVTALGPNSPARMLGAVFYVGGTHEKSDATATRLQVKEAP